MRDASLERPKQNRREENTEGGNQQRKWSTTLESKWYRRGSRTLDRNGPSDKGGTQLPPTSTVSSIAGHHPYGRLTSPGPPHLRHCRSIIALSTQPRCLVTNYFHKVAFIQQ
ncbi:hypothetical protein KIN20_007896 [Parelaphostrongylus tenuis]|uniref:Uncharacterized protein n=1 Tax=Parelaphostrongylus tenuis TaxID=148309 RepID=A0AAD5QKC8_PARTN|nr:hypothetical protein KIN20_007896 [Parelaphostrongylus tenuis]